MVRMILVLLVLNLLFGHPLYQASLLVGIESICLGSILKHAPYIMLAQSRCEMISAFCRLLIYTLALLPETGAISATTAASFIIPLMFTALLNNMLTQLYPLLGIILAAMDILLSVLLFRSTHKFNVGDVVFSLVERSGPHIEFEYPTCFDTLMCSSCNMLSIFNDRTSKSNLLDNPAEKKEEPNEEEGNFDGGDLKVTRGDEGVVVGTCSKKQFPEDYHHRMLVEFPNGLILGLLATEPSVEMTLNEEVAHLIPNQSRAIKEIQEDRGVGTVDDPLAYKEPSSSTTMPIVINTPSTKSPLPLSTSSMVSPSSSRKTKSKAERSSRGSDRYQEEEEVTKGGEGNSGDGNNTKLNNTVYFSSFPKSPLPESSVVRGTSLDDVTVTTLLKSSNNPPGKSSPTKEGEKKKKKKKKTNGTSTILLEPQRETVVDI